MREEVGVEQRVDELTGFFGTPGSMTGGEVDGQAAPELGGRDVLA